MSYAHVQGTTHSGQTGNSPTATFGSAVTSGGVVTGVVGWVGASDGTDTLTSVTDDKANSYTVVGKIFNNGNPYYWAEFFSNTKLTNGPTAITATISSSGANFDVVMIDEWSGFPGSYAEIGHNSATSAGAGTLSATMTSSASALNVGYAVDINSGGITAGQTQVQNVISTWMAEWDAGSSSSDTMTATMGGGGGGTLQAVSLSPGSPPPPPPPPQGGGMRLRLGLHFGVN